MAAAESSKEKFNPRNPPQLQAPKTDPIAVEYLSKCDGSNEGYPVCVAIKGIVFDVSANKSYAPGSSYHVFAGKDASRALAKTSLKVEDCVPDWQDLSDREKAVLEDWSIFFRKRYNILGQVERPLEQATAT